MSKDAVTAQEYLREALRFAPPGARAWVTKFASPPDADPEPKGRWVGAPCTPDTLPHINGANAYCSTAAYAADTKTRNTDNALGTFAIVADDVGTKVAASHVLETLGEPTTRIETSPGNEQWHYLLDALYPPDQVKPVNDRLVELRLSDPEGVNSARYVRLPAGINNKSKLTTPHQVRMVDWQPDLRYALADLAERLAITPSSETVQVRRFELPDSIEEGGRDSTLAAYCLSLLNKGLGESEVTDLALAANRERCKPPLSESVVRKKVKSAVRKFKAKPNTASLLAGGPAAERLTLQQMLMRFAYIERGKLVVDINNPDLSWEQEEFHRAFVTSTLRVAGKDKKGNPVDKDVPISQMWAKHPNHATAFQFGFDPSEPEFFVRDHNERVFNLYRKPTWPDVDIELARPFVEHIEWLIPNGVEREHLLDWLAATAQQPGIRPHWHCLLIAEEEGTGRGWIGDTLAQVLGKSSCAPLDLYRLLDANFNAELSRKTLVYMAEVHAPTSERYKAVDRLKGFLTDAEWWINQKNMKVYREKACARFLMFSNHLEAVPVSEMDRRIYVIKCVSTPRDKEYYTRLYGLLLPAPNKEFLAAVWKFLMTRDLSNYSPGMRAPLNEIKRSIIEAGRNDEQQQAVMFMQRARFEVIVADDLWEILRPANESTDVRAESTRKRSIIHALKEAGFCTADKHVRVMERTGGSNQACGLPQTLWIAKNKDHWKTAPPDQVKDAVKATREILSRTCGGERLWNLRKAISAWSDEPVVSETVREY